MRYLKNFKMFESAQDSDSAQDVAFFDIFPSDLIDDLYDASTEYFDRGLSLLIKTRIGDEHVFSQVFNNKHKTSDMKLDINNYDEIIELFNDGKIPEIEFCIVDDYFINDYNGVDEDDDVWETLTDEDGNPITDMGDYSEYNEKILDVVKEDWPDYDLKICEFPWDN